MTHIYLNADDPDGIAELTSAMASVAPTATATEVPIENYGINTSVSFVIDISLSPPEIIAIASLLYAYLRRRPSNWVSDRPSMGKICRQSNEQEIPQLIEGLSKIRPEQSLPDSEATEGQTESQ